MGNHQMVHSSPSSSAVLHSLVSVTSGQLQSENNSIKWKTPERNNSQIYVMELCTTLGRTMKFPAVPFCPAEEVNRSFVWHILPISHFVALVVQTVKNPPAMQETWVWSLGWEDFLEKGVATHPSILVWRIHWQRNLASYSPWDHIVRHDWSN